MVVTIRLGKDSTSEAPPWLYSCQAVLKKGILVLKHISSVFSMGLNFYDYLL
jgi:hypothetical protein